jgi:hypothetical protein
MAIVGPPPTRPALRPILNPHPTHIKSFRAELISVAQSLPKNPSRLVRDENITERCRNLLRAWSGNVAPELHDLVSDRSALLKTQAELEAIAKLTAKLKPVKDYSLRFDRIIALTDFQESSA